ncbi:hypothetical protein MJL79_16785, partial [Salmonella enterica subsp. enterica serovar Montevideo]|nr:hypothetical protein [Salmonella enterica subsp. enterica serovar Montevideo]
GATKLRPQTEKLFLGKFAQIVFVHADIRHAHDFTQMRIDYLTRYGKPFTTLVYIPGHIMLYIGNTTMNGQVVPMTYQNIWGLRPNHANSRSIIGEAVFLPLLRFYPENPELISLAGKVLFKLGYIE